MLRIIRTSKSRLWKCSKNYSTISADKLKRRLDVSEEVANCLQNNRPIVALESTIITHGMPYPRNLETALEVEAMVRRENVTPATIGIIEGRIKVGLSHDELERLADTQKTSSLKTSRRDFGYVLSQKLNGGTTVAGTMIVANLVGIKVFATGGIGGVHREGHITMDISADLVELGRTPVTVVSSGVKSILDIPRTLEYLETQGVLVGTFDSENGEFPAFYTRSSGSTVPYNFKNAFDVANVIQGNCDLGLQSGILIAVPIPKEYAMDESVINNAISSALSSAKNDCVEGKEITPYLLANISKITKGLSLESNVALIKNNARVAANISAQLSLIQSNKVGHVKNSSIIEDNKSPVIIGGSILDTCITVLDDNLKVTSVQCYTAM